MGIVKDFVESDSLGWDITRDEFMTKVLDELDKFPQIICVVTADKVSLLKKDYIRVKVVTPKDNGNPTGSIE